MSQIETHIGKLKKIHYDRNGLTLENWCKNISNLTELPSLYNNWIEYVKTYLYKKYIIIENKYVFQIIESEEFDNSDYFAKFLKIDEDTYAFFSSFYNGGTHLTEMIEDEFPKIL